MKAGENCSAIGCKYHDLEINEKGICIPFVQGKLLEWFEHRDAGEMVDRAPNWPCPFYTGDFFK
uniref:Uncharacterized protein n=1 Tax=viral metagenome TaxID=1070528 RepID=A0A6M3JJL9_9ZZZZ